jgi:hypothetical protein
MKGDNTGAKRRIWQYDRKLLTWKALRKLDVGVLGGFVAFDPRP